MTDPAKIAEGLSVGVKTMLTMPEPGDWFDRNSWKMFGPNDAAFASAVEQGLVERKGGKRPKFRILPLGLQVRAHLQREKPNG